ncbi:MAG: serine hydrolase, partial [Anaerolineae bacterium]
PQVQVNDNGASWLAGWPRRGPNLIDGVYWGLGWGLEEGPRARAIWHWGDNDGFKSFAIAYPEAGEGLVVMTNSDRGLMVAAAAVELCFGSEQPAMRWLGSFYGF